MQNKLVLGLREYRSLHLTQSRGSVPHNGLILPPAMRLAPAWILGALRTAALRGSVREVSGRTTLQCGGVCARRCCLHSCRRPCYVAKLCLGASSTFEEEHHAVMMYVDASVLGSCSMRRSLQCCAKAAGAEA